jgi:phospholipid transport system transporter-binding protein
MGALQKQGAVEGPGTFSVEAGGRATVAGSLSFATVTGLLPAGARAIEEGKAASIDLSAVSAGDSAGLALLIEWLSVAKAAGKTLHYENIPAQLMQLARVSEVEELLSGAPGAAN